MFDWLGTRLSSKVTGPPPMPESVPVPDPPPPPKPSYKREFFDLDQFGVPPQRNTHIFAGVIPAKINPYEYWAQCPDCYAFLEMDTVHEAPKCGCGYSWVLYATVEGPKYIEVLAPTTNAADSPESSSEE